MSRGPRAKGLRTIGGGAHRRFFHGVTMEEAETSFALFHQKSGNRTLSCNCVRYGVPALSPLMGGCMLNEKLTAFRHGRQSTDRRRSSRPRVNRAGTIKLPGRVRAEPCVILDISSDGARIRTANPAIGFSRLVYLTVPSLDLMVACEIVWVGEAEIGVLFRQRFAPPHRRGCH